MRKSSKKRVLILSIILLVTFLFVCWYIPYIKPVSVKAVEHLDSVLEIHMIDVGQAESILVVQGEHAMLIDTGDMFDGKTVVRYLQSVGINKLDAVIITHYHNDHSGGIHDVLSAIEVKKVVGMRGKYISTTQELFWYSDMQISRTVSSMVHLKRISLESPYKEAGVLRTMWLGDAEVDFLSQETHTNIVNNKSSVMKVSYKDVSALFTGDSQKEVEDSLLEAEIDVSADILNVGHHGSKTSTSMDFLEKVNPEYALISCGEDNEYGHPNSFVMEKLQNQKARVYRTDLDGNVVLETDGTKEGIMVMTSK